MRWEYLLLHWTRHWSRDGDEWTEHHRYAVVQLEDGKADDVIGEGSPKQTLYELGRDGWELVTVETERLHKSPQEWSGNSPRSMWYERSFWFKRLVSE